MNAVEAKAYGLIDEVLDRRRRGDGQIRLTYRLLRAVTW